MKSATLHKDARKIPSFLGAPRVSGTFTGEFPLHEEIKLMHEKRKTEIELFAIEKKLREMERSKPENRERARRAEAELAGESKESRKKAAVTLGAFRYIESYPPLLRALRKENERCVQFRILIALKNIGEEYYGTQREVPSREHKPGNGGKRAFAPGEVAEILAKGLDPHYHFLKSSLHDAKLVEVAVQAFRLTGRSQSVLDHLYRIMHTEEYKSAPRDARGSISSTALEIEVPH